ncbi:hypothetical protein SLA2020_300450 [Shorea laevis]
MSTSTLPTCCLAQASALGKSSFLTKKPSSLGYMKGVPRGYGLKSTHFKVSAMAVYKVKLIGPNGEENEFEAPDDTYILDSAKNAGLERCHTHAGLVLALLVPVNWSLDQWISPRDHS